MKRPLIALGFLLAAAAIPLPSFAHSDVSVRVNLGLPVAPAVVYYDAWRPAPQPVYYYEPAYRPVVIYREYEGRHHRGHHRGRGHHAHHHDRYCRH